MQTRGLRHPSGHRASGMRANDGERDDFVRIFRSDAKKQHLVEARAVSHDTGFPIHGPNGNRCHPPLNRIPAQSSARIGHRHKNIANLRAHRPVGRRHSRTGPGRHQTKPDSFPS